MNKNKLNNSISITQIVRYIFFVANIWPFNDRYNLFIANF